MIKRDSKKVLREYNQEKWPYVLRKINDVISRGEKSLSRVLSLTLDELRHNKENKKIDVIFDGKQPIEILSSFAYGGNQSFISNKIISSSIGEELTIVELGSGYGRNLFWLWLHGGPKNAKYLACELAETGRECTKRLASLATDMNIETHHFDFYKPDIKSIIKDSKNILFFTCHSIEQIPFISQDFFDELLISDATVKCIHFEPIGWQIRKTTGTSDLVGSNEQHAEQNDYNRNLWEILNLLKSQNKIDLDEVAPEIIGINTVNSTSLISWHKL